MAALIIPVGGGQVTIVSPEDETIARRYSWFAVKVNGNRFYAMRGARVGGRRGKSKTHYLHRIIAGAKPGEIVDHINGDGLDNRRENLRLCDGTLNNANRRAGPVAASGYRGVHRSGKRLWRAVLEARGITYRGGSFTDKEAAARRYDELARTHFGEFAVLNFPGDA